MSSATGMPNLIGTAKGLPLLTKNSQTGWPGCDRSDLPKYDPKELIPRGQYGQYLMHGLH